MVGWELGEEKHKDWIEFTNFGYLRSSNVHESALSCLKHYHYISGSAFNMGLELKHSKGISFLFKGLQALFNSNSDNSKISLWNILYHQALPHFYFPLFFAAT